MSRLDVGAIIAAMIALLGSIYIGYTTRSVAEQEHRRQRQDEHNRIVAIQEADRAKRIDESYWSLVRSLQDQVQALQKENDALHRELESLRNDNLRLRARIEKLEECIDAN